VRPASSRPLGAVPPAEALLLAAALALALVGPAAWALGAGDPPWAAATFAGALLAYAAGRRAIGAAGAALALPFAGAFALLWAGAGLSLIARPEAVNAALAMVAVGGATAVVAADLARRDRGPERAFAAATTALGAAAAVAIGAWLTGFRDLVPFTPDGQGRLAWPFTHPNYLGFTCAALLPLAVVAAVAARRRAPRIAICLAIALGLAALTLSASRSAWIGAAAGVAVILAYGPARRAIAIGALATLALASPVILQRVGDADEGRGNVRFQIWDDALSAFADRPATGVGINGFSRHARPLAEQVGQPIPGHAHELFLGRAAETGILGLAGVVAVLALALLAAHRGARGPAGPRRLLAIGTVAALAATVVTGLLDDPLDDRAAQLVVWALLGLAGALGGRRALALRTGRPGSSGGTA
jgi:O-antigen ligase